ncbi:MAG: hypothetical protein OXE85_02270 [Roseovarius sp.]|nr:hypothetical protein [Roseovarius sp.]
MVGVFRYKGRRIVVSHSSKHARKDACDRDRALAKLLQRLKKSSAPEQVLGKRGAHRDVRIVGDLRIEADEEKIGSAEAGDGLRGVVTNLKGIGVVELFSRYRQLWQVRRVFGSPNMIRARARSSIGSSGGSARIWPYPL